MVAGKKDNVNLILAMYSTITIFKILPWSLPLSGQSHMMVWIHLLSRIDLLLLMQDYIQLFHQENCTQQFRYKD